MFLMVAKDCTERLSAVALSVGRIILRVTWSERVRHRNAWTEIAWKDAVQGLGMAMSTVASEENREMLFIGNVFLVTSLRVVSLAFRGHDLLKIANINPRQGATRSHTTREIKKAAISEFSPSLKSSKSREQFLLRLILFYSIYG